MTSKMKKIISLGGSVIDPSELDIEKIKQFGRDVKYEEFVTVVGGGHLAREYIKAIDNESEKTKDKIGILATVLNAQIVSEIIDAKVVHPSIIGMKYAIETAKKKSQVVSSGWKPGFSSDYVTAYFAKELKVKEIINITSVGGVYTKNPNKFKDAELIKQLSWKKYLKEFVKKERWFAGESLPFDPVASKLCSKEKIKVIIVNLENFGKLMNNDEFTGTVIE